MLALFIVEILLQLALSPLDIGHLLLHLLILFYVCCAFLVPLGLTLLQTLHTDTRMDKRGWDDVLP